jgi:hypothetical protein
MNAGSIFNSTRVKTIREGLEPILRYMKGGAAVVTSPEAVPIGKQLVETFIYTLVFSIAMQLIEMTFSSLKRYQNMAITLFPLTYDNPQTYPQDPDSGFELILPSKDERNGTEYSYSCFISVMPETFTGEEGTFKHVYHKGSKGVYPLMAPGVFFKSDKNTLRVYQNSSMAWDNYVDIENFPIRKWVHLVVMMKGKSLDIYINGNLANRKKFTDLPKLNYGAFYLMLPKVVNKKTDDSCEMSKIETETRRAEKVASDAALQAAMNISVEDSAKAGALAGGMMAGLSAAQSGDSAVELALKAAGGTFLGGVAGAGSNIANKFNALGNNISANVANQRVNSVTTITETDRDLGANLISVNGRMNGYISRVKYFAFALSYAQIDKLIREGPNPKRSGGGYDMTTPAVSFGYDVVKGPKYVPNPNAIDNNLPGYQSDSWWTSTDFMGSNAGPEPGNHFGWGPQ